MFSKDKVKCIPKLGIIIVFVIFFLLRLYRLGYHDFWYDEISTIGYAQYPWNNWNAPLYYIISHFWINIFGISEFSVRLPSLVFSLSAVIMTFILGKELFCKKIGFFAALLMGLSPFHLWYAQEARDYSMLLFMGLLSTWLFFNALRKNKLRKWIFFIFISILGIYTNYFYIILFFTQFLYLIIFRRGILKLNFKWVLYFAVIFLGFSFYLPRFLSKFFYVWGGFWVPEPEWKSLIITLENFILGYNGSCCIYFIFDIIIGLIFIRALASAYKHKEIRGNFLFCIFLFLCPILLIFSFSKIFFSIYLDRGLIVFSPYFYLILALGLTSFRGIIRKIILTVLSAVIITADYGYLSDFMVMPFIHHTGVYIKKPVKIIVDFLLHNVTTQDIIAFTNESTTQSIMFYANDKIGQPYYFFDPLVNEDNWNRPYEENNFCVPFYKINNLKFKSLWVISSDWERSGGLDENSQSVKNWLDNNLRLESSKEFDGLWLFQYKR